ncbi:type II secretion system inner membrane protein GspF [Cocleimonas flava]|jgi:general secretion pathway protein F|uniref:General secretion pathway protein F n=1 Tax=Cocleimonas flava TaxID=634765 RepID=A0A4R1F4X2_9GAMM|nr:MULTISPECIES: type II secretion system inner membrane protein GspF [Cocleimonas]MEB8432898.1 type II secretion system inner membrane protein GspF [Cocleimonas sp. KMM 6892]MEC4716121.1 type II secretion system inner membrane protein GspF [Cocleimonas sp. KMM 6895]MEC4745582.1 type II secretion system inner membrane protein GspF [Cocleimonas sp. KMM 6896]TCJ87644.1 general secretion pathway protein F [Cocleimonas flava]
MPAFEYIALDAKGQEEKGMLEADNAKQIRQILRDGNLTPLEVNQVEKSENNNKVKTRRAGKVKASELALLTRQLATLVQSGSPLEEALATTAKQSEKRNIKHILSAVRSKVVEGFSFADGLKTYPSVFPDMYRATVAAGEQSGHLDAVLERMADYTESRQETQQRISTAMFYPVILTILSVAIVAGLLAFIVPKIVDVFDNVGQELPAMTQVLIAISDFVRAYGIYIAVLLVVLFIVFKQMIKIPKWKYRYHSFLLKVPLIKKMVRGLNTARFARTLSILASSGVPILDAMSISAQVVQNMPMRQAVTDAAIKVREGMTINRALEQSGYFPPMTVYLIASGESSGRLDDMLERAAMQQERETDAMLTNMLGIFEPVLILVMGAVVLLIVLSILLPILNLNQLVL